METYDVRFLQEALDDLEEIVLYIRQDSQAAAMKMHDKIVEKANMLSTFPKLGRPVPDAKMRKAGFRILIIDPYMAFYKVIGNNVFIYQIIHGAMNYPLLYAKMREIKPPQD
jgi:plasmid stabilization system protein ParE